MAKADVAYHQDPRFRLIERAIEIISSSASPSLGGNLGCFGNSLRRLISSASRSGSLSTSRSVRAPGRPLANNHIDIEQFYIYVYKMGPPSETPIGLLLSQTAKRLSRAFDEALAAAGGSLPMWLILTSLMREGMLSHGELAQRVGVQGPTLTHHLDAMADQGLVLRERPPDNRRVQFARLTPAGVAKFHRLRTAAVEHDKRIRSYFSDEELLQMRTLLTRLAKDFAGPPSQDHQENRE